MTCHVLLMCMMLCYIVSVLRWFVLYCFVLHVIVSCWIVLCCVARSVLHHDVFDCANVHAVVLRCSCIALVCIVLCCMLWYRGGLYGVV